MGEMVPCSPYQVRTRQRVPRRPSSVPRTETDRRPSFILVVPCTISLTHRPRASPGGHLRRAADHGPLRHWRAGANLYAEQFRQLDEAAFKRRLQPAIRAILELGLEPVDMNPRNVFFTPDAEGSWLADVAWQSELTLGVNRSSLDLYTVFIMQPLLPVL